MKYFNCRGSRWSEIGAETNKSMKKAGYVLIGRQPSYWIMKKQGGQMATVIDVMPNELPKSVRQIGLDIVSKYN